MSIFWAILLVAMIILEAATAQFVSIWFAGGALAALICSMLTLEVWVQVAVFISVTLILLVLTRKIFKKLKGTTPEKTNIDAIIGQTALVTKTISNKMSEGTVKLGGMTWSARSDNGEVIEEGETVNILKIDGVKLIVNKIQEV